MLLARLQLACSGVLSTKQLLVYTPALQAQVSDISRSASAAWAPITSGKERLCL